MNILILSWKSIVSKPLSSLLSWLLLSFGVTVVVLILLASDQLKNEISRNSKGIDLVVGAKGSPLQLILANIFHVDFPTGNIPLKEAAELSRNRYIGSAIPLSLGDSYRNFRIVGTTHAYGEVYGAELGEGAWFEKPMEAVIGAGVAKALSLELGATFESQHGLSEEGDAHGGHPFLVKGILKQSNTVLDRLILTDLVSIWEVHGHEEEEPGSDSLIEISHLGLKVTLDQYEEEEITALLIGYRSPMGAVMLPRAINSKSAFQAASPAYETARLFNIIGVGVKVVNLLGILIIIISAISVFIALLNSLKERKYDIAIMRSMGATRLQIFLHILIEGLLVTLAGSLSGLIFAHLALGIAAGYFETASTEIFSFVAVEGLVVLGCLVIGVLASVFPALMAYRTDISKTLAKA